MGQLIQIPDMLNVTGKVTAISRSVFSKEIIDIQEAKNTLASAFKNAIVKDLALGLRTSAPKVMAFSRDTVSNSPFPTAFTNEFRGSISTFPDQNKFQIVCVLGSTEGNSGGGNIKTIGFYIGDDATTTVGTGTLASIVNTLNVAKTSAIEVTFQYEITFS